PPPPAPSPVPYTTLFRSEQVSASERNELPRPSIDTGMGLERIAAVLQGTHDNYAIDLFRAIIRAVAELTGVDSNGPQKASHRVIDRKSTRLNSSHASISY